MHGLSRKGTLNKLQAVWGSPECSNLLCQAVECFISLSAEFQSLPGVLGCCPGSFAPEPSALRSAERARFWGHRGTPCLGR